MPIPDNMTIADFVEWRHTRRLSREGAAHALGYSLHTIQSWEQRRRTFPGTRIPLIIRGLKLDT